MENHSDISELRYLRLSQVLQVIPISKTAWWAGVKSGKFPASVKLGPRTTAWKSADIRKLCESLANGESV